MIDEYWNVFLFHIFNNGSALSLRLDSSFSCDASDTIKDSWVPFTLTLTLGVRAFFNNISSGLGCLLFVLPTLLFFSSL